jgi:hypothetical protein
MWVTVELVNLTGRWHPIHTFPHGCTRTFNPAVNLARNMQCAIRTWTWSARTTLF